MVYFFIFHLKGIFKGISGGFTACPRKMLEFILIITNVCRHAPPAAAGFCFVPLLSVMISSVTKR